MDQGEVWITYLNLTINWHLHGCCHILSAILDSESSQCPVDIVHCTSFRDQSFIRIHFSYNSCTLLSPTNWSGGHATLLCTYFPIFHGYCDMSLLRRILKKNFQTYMFLPSSLVNLGAGTNRGFALYEAKMKNYLPGEFHLTTIIFRSWRLSCISLS